MKYFAPKFLIFRVGPFQKGLPVQESKREVKRCLLCKILPSFLQVYQTV